MSNIIKKGLSVGLLVLISYLVFWPVAVEPVAWQAPVNMGYNGDFSPNQELSQISRIELQDNTLQDGTLQHGIGPEDLAVDKNNHVYFGLHNGDIKYLNSEGKIQHWVNTGGRPLGIEFDQQGNLLVADAFNGLLSISTDGTITTLVDSIDGIPISYANDVDVASNGNIYFSDASSKFHAKKYGTYGASLLDINEHGGHARIIEYNPTDKISTVLAHGINFANGVTLSHDEQSLLFNETGTYRVMRLNLKGEQRGNLSVVIDNLPSFPDNITRGTNGVYWLGLVSPRSKPLDLLSDSPSIRKVIQRLPEVLRPKAQYYGHLIAINDTGEVIHNLQDPLGKYGNTTGALEVSDQLYISSWNETALGVIENVHH